MPQKASPLSSPTLSVTSLGAIFLFVTWYEFCLERHFFICLQIFRILFCIFYFNKNVKDSLYHAYFASIHVAVSKQKVYRCCKNSLEKSENDLMLKLFAYWALINLLQRSIFLIIFGVRKVWWILHSLHTTLFWQIAVMVALFAYVCLFNDSIWG